jgi:hypothetical protein
MIDEQRVCMSGRNKEAMRFQLDEATVIRASQPGYLFKQAAYIVEDLGKSLRLGCNDDDPSYQSTINLAPCIDHLPALRPWNKGSLLCWTRPDPHICFSMRCLDESTSIFSSARHVHPEPIAAGGSERYPIRRAFLCQHRGLDETEARWCQLSALLSSAIAADQSTWRRLHHNFHASRRTATHLSASARSLCMALLVTQNKPQILHRRQKLDDVSKSIYAGHFREENEGPLPNCRLQASEIWMPYV